jgi:hypothetical protein
MRRRRQLTIEPHSHPVDQYMPYDHVRAWHTHITDTSGVLRPGQQIAFRGQIDVRNEQLVPMRAPIFFMLTLTGRYAPECICSCFIPIDCFFFAVNGIKPYLCE